MGEIAKYLRFLINADKEGKISRVVATITPTIFASQLTSEQTRRRIGVFNNSNEGSGECYYSFSTPASPSGESIPLPKGETTYLPIAETTNISLYFFCEAGEVADLRVLELA